MTNRIRISLIVLVLALAQNAWSTPPEEAEQTASTKPTEQSALEQLKKPPPKARKVCKSFPPTGSRIGKKICLSQASWDEMARKAKNTLDSSTKPTSNNRKGE